MPKLLTSSQALKVWIGAIVAALVVIGGGRASDFILRADHPSLALRWLVVVLAILTPTLLVGVAVWGYWVCDEFQRRIVLVGTAVAFVASVLVYTALSALQDVQLVGRDIDIPYLPGAAVIWLASVALTAAHARIRP